MAITIQSTPDKFTPAFNPVVFNLTSTNYAQPDFKYVADVYSGTGDLLASLKYQAPPGGVTPISIDVSRILYELIASDYLKLNSVANPNIVTTSGAAISDYSVQFGEQYDDTVYANLASYSGYVFNGAVNNLRFAFYDDATYVNTQFLTRFNRQVARKRDSVMISILQSETSAISWFNLTIYNSAGAVLYASSASTIVNPFTSLSTTNQRLLHLHVGFDYLFSVLSFPSSAYNNAAYYTLSTPGGTSFRIDLYSQCERFLGIRLHFLNELGGFDSFNFMLDSKASQTSERKQYLRQATNRRTGYDAANKRFEVLNRNYHSSYKERIKAISDYLTDTESQLLGELLTSSLVYMEADASLYGGTGTVLIPMNITTMDYEIKKSKVDKLFNLELDMEYSTDNYRQVV